MSELINIREGLALYKRGKYPSWQARIKVGNEWVRKSTRQKAEEKAKEAGLDLYYDYRAKKKNNLPTISKKFSNVADYVIEELEDELAAGTGKVVYSSYINAINNYLKPFFGKYNIDKITPILIKQFEAWRIKQMKKIPAASTITTHNSALNRVFDYAIIKGWVTNTLRPKLSNKGKKSESRPCFTRPEYATLVRKLRSWCKKGKREKSKQMRELLRDYVLILTNTGIRHGTEADNLKWRHIDWHIDKNEKFIRITVNGKTGNRSLIARVRTGDYLKRIQSRFPELACMTFDELLAAKVDEYVFRLDDGSRTKNLRQPFRKFLRDTELAIGADSETERTLYSLRHTYATFALMKGIGIHDLARQMGTGVGTIDNYYSKITPELMAHKFAGRRNTKVKPKKTKKKA